MGDNISHMTNPPQVMSPNMKQNPSRDSTSAHETPPEKTSRQSKKRERKEEDPARPNQNNNNSMSRRNQEKTFPPDMVLRPDAYRPSSGHQRRCPSEAPWTWAMSELRCVQRDV